MTEFRYPLQFEPFFQNYLWGGRKLATRLGKPIPADGVWAESWEIIDHPHHQSVIINGPAAGRTIGQLIQERPADILGRRLQSLGRLPLLLKYLDCQQVLSVQVHPSDAYALRMTPPDLGKTEAWYIVDCEPGATIYAGLRSGVSRRELSDALGSGRVEQCLHRIEPRAGDCVFVPAGTVHALGAGLLVAEIQQSSNTTFRLYDWDRTGPDGKPRPLHIDQALEVISFDSGPCPIQSPMATDQPGRQRLVACDQFCLDRWSGSQLNGQEVAVGQPDSFSILTVPEGEVELRGDGFHRRLLQGQSCLLPAIVDICTVSISSAGVLLDMYVGGGQ
jgi:mannose-6-phosphate isomerase